MRKPLQSQECEREDSNLHVLRTLDPKSRPDALVLREIYIGSVLLHVFYNNVTLSLDCT